jgi:selT/selW/selH-like putative selenoprotein
VAELQAKFPGEIDSELIKGSKGAFEVVIDGELIYSKWKTKEFPRYGEIPRIIVSRR